MQDFSLLIHANVAGPSTSCRILSSSAPRATGRESGNATDDPEDPEGGVDRRMDTEVEPGGETKVRRSECVPHESADADVDWDVGEARRDAQVARESAASGTS